MNDIEIIYEAVKHHQNLLLTNTFALNEGFSWDVPVICGKSIIGRFWLYANQDVKKPQGIMFVFSIEYEKKTWLKKRLIKCNTHWHPLTIEQAIEDVNNFMLGKLSFKK